MNCNHWNSAVTITRSHRNKIHFVKFLRHTVRNVLLPAEYCRRLLGWFRQRTTPQRALLLPGPAVLQQRQRTKQWLESTSVSSRIDNLFLGMPQNFPFQRWFLSILYDYVWIFSFFKSSSNGKWGKEESHSFQVFLNTSARKKEKHIFLHAWHVRKFGLVITCNIHVKYANFSKHFCKSP